MARQQQRRLGRSDARCRASERLTTGRKSAGAAHQSCGAPHRFTIGYVFAELAAGPSTVVATRSLADEVLGSTRSANAFVGNFNTYQNASIDPTQPTSFSRIESPRFQAPGSNANYTDARGQIGSTLGNQIAMPSLMPSSPDFRTPAAGNSNAPNIRAALFTLPIVRLTYAELGLRGYNSMPTGAAAHSVPGTPLADARLVPTVRASTTTGIPRSIATATPRTATPMCKTPPIPPLSRGDFSAQVLHYRLRGANSVNLFGGASVVGYGAAAAQEDIRAGWSASSRVNEIFASGGDRGGLPEDRGLHARD